MKKSKIGIVSTLFLDNKISKISVSSDYVNAIEKAAGLPLIIPITSNLENIDSYIDLMDSYLLVVLILIHIFIKKILIRSLANLIVSLIYFSFH